MLGNHAQAGPHSSPCPATPPIVRAPAPIDAPKAPDAHFPPHPTPRGAGRLIGALATVTISRTGTGRRQLHRPQGRVRQRRRQRRPGGCPRRRVRPDTPRRPPNPGARRRGPSPRRQPAGRDGLARRRPSAAHIAMKPDDTSSLRDTSARCQISYSPAIHRPLPADRVYTPRTLRRAPVRGSNGFPGLGKRT